MHVEHFVVTRSTSLSSSSSSSTSRDCDFLIVYSLIGDVFLRVSQCLARFANSNCKLSTVAYLLNGRRHLLMSCSAFEGSPCSFIMGKLRGSRQAKSTCSFPFCRKWRSILSETVSRMTLWTCTLYAVRWV